MELRHSLQKAALDQLFAGCEKQGLSMQALFAECGYDVKAVQADSFRLPSQALGRVIQRAAQILNDETLGFFSRPTKLGGVKVGVLYALRGKTLREALFRFFKYAALLHDDIDVSLTEQGEEARLKLVVTSADARHNMLIYITLMLFVFRFASWLVNQRILLNRIYLAGKTPVYDDEIRSTFPCRHYFHPTHNEMCLQRASLDMPVARQEEDIAAFIQTLPDLLTNRMIDASVTAQVKRMLREQDSIEGLPLKAVAQRLNKSPQTIRRYLSQENTSFAEIKENVRKDMAIFQLTQSDTAIKHIAYQVGFSEPSAFIRAFKKWTGLTPGEWREQH